ncbi:molybdopterin-guanine dinucleotide biosynthesis protein B [Chthonobacter rhizosphaerae]|uniref:molybdopterin-guanine dinucleotide biosynthesis protein B n=1 Tax=Chthonobacter rhizosphaerae TaxID=2735553 RepID=UPI0015EF257D
MGVAGWKNAGKTTLVVGLVTAFVARGLSVATVKHAHHGFDVDHPGTDSHRHRQAGAGQTALVSARRVALMKELASPDEEPSLADVLAALDPADVVVVEGWKREPIPKVEVRRREAARHDPLHPADPAVVAIAADHPVEASVPTFSLDEIDRLADYLLTLRP